MNPETKLSIPAHVMSRLVDDETVLLDLQTGLYFGLDGVGKLIWESIGDGRNLGEIATLITSEYEVDEAQALTDAIDFTSDLVERGLLVQ